MKIKKTLEVSTNNFWYDLTAGGYLDPKDLCVNLRDAMKVREAIKIVQDYENSCVELITY